MYSCIEHNASELQAAHEHKNKDRNELCREVISGLKG